MRRELKKDILNGKLSEQILLFTIPVCGAYLLQQLYQFADSIVLGRYAGVEALAAVGGSATMLVNVLLNLISGITTGSMVVVAQSFGRGNHQKVKEAVKTSMFIAIVFGGLVSIVSALSAKPLLVLMKCPEETIDLSLIYLYSYFVGIIPYSIYQFGIYILRASGDTKVSLLFTIIIAIVKIVFDIILTGVMNLGVWGVSISTIISYVVCGVVVLMILHKTTNLYQYEITDFGYEKETLKNIFKIGIPIAIQSAIFAITNALVSVKVNEHGTNAIAAYSAYNNVDNFYWSFTNAIGAAIVTIVGQNFGNKNMKRVKESLKQGVIIHLIFTVIISLFVYFFGTYVVRIFTTENNVIDIATRMLKITAISYVTYVPVEMVSGTIKGCGDSVNSMIIAIIGICVTRITFLMIFNFKYVESIILCYPLSWTITSIIYLTYYFTNKKYRLS